MKLSTAMLIVGLFALMVTGVLVFTHPNRPSSSTAEPAKVKSEPRRRRVNYIRDVEANLCFASTNAANLLLIPCDKVPANLLSSF